ncbi:MAG: winged helix-turn-helix domain-containing protein, partial [Verrucomicrobia bacterium]|nr:winged helix-turn-helix domain-containing protein [Verrucomicrobiota bacterium]
MNTIHCCICERIMKGAANHRRIQILQLLSHQPSLTLYEIRDGIGVANQTASEHLRRLCFSGLVQKRPLGRLVLHNLSPLGRQMVAWLQPLTT